MASCSYRVKLCKFHYFYHLCCFFLLFWHPIFAQTSLSDAQSYQKIAEKFLQAEKFDSVRVFDVNQKLSQNSFKLTQHPEALKKINAAADIKQKNSPEEYTVLSSINTQGNVLKLMGNDQETLVGKEAIRKDVEISAAKRVEGNVTTFDVTEVF